MEVALLKLPPYDGMNKDMRDPSTLTEGLRPNCSIAGLNSSKPSKLGTTEPNLAKVGHCRNRHRLGIIPRVKKRTQKSALHAVACSAENKNRYTAYLSVSYRTHMLKNDLALLEKLDLDYLNFRG